MSHQTNPFRDLSATFNLMLDDEMTPIDIAVPAMSLQSLGLGNLTGSTVTTTTVTTAKTVSGATASVPVIKPSVGAIIAGHSQTVAISAMFKLPSGAAAPSTLILNVLDRIEYTAGFNSKSLDTLTAGKVTTQLSANGGDAMTAGMVFSYQASSGRYINTAGTFLDQVTLTTGTNTGDQASVSLFACASASTASAYAASSTTLLSNPGIFTYEASVSVLTLASAATVPAQATPGGIAAAALSMVGHAWNDNGCWVLASTIADKAGASLPAGSTLVGTAGVGNGEWVVAYNGAVSANSNWIASLRTGEIVSFVTTSGGGHITTVASGSGAQSMLVDNMAVGNGRGGFSNSANDGQAADITIVAPHAATQEFTGVNPALVCVYALDTPIVTTAAPISVGLGKTAALAGAFSATNPVAGQTVTSWQLYDQTTSDHLTLAGVSEDSARSATTAFTTSSLSNVGFVAGTAANSDTVMARAFNGSYWSDWSSLSVKVG